MSCSEAQSMAKVKKTFMRFDGNGNGYLENNELRRALEYHWRDTTGLNMTTAEAGHILATYDNTPDGKLNLAEFALIIRDLSAANARQAIRRVSVEPPPTLVRKTSRFNLNKIEVTADDAPSAPPKVQWGCSHLLPINVDYKYHVLAQAAPTRKSPFDRDLTALVDEGVKALRNPEIVRSDPQLHFLSDEPLDVSAIRSSSDSTPHRTLTGNQSAPFLSLPRLGSSRAPSRSSRQATPNHSSSTSPSFRALPRYRPPVSSLVARLPCLPERHLKLEAAAATFDLLHGELVEVACEKVDAERKEPHNSTVVQASSGAVDELSRHRFFIPERAGGPLDRFEKREGPKKKSKPKVPWTLPRSIWKERANWCDAQAFCDTEEVRRQHFEAIWDRALQSGLRKFIGRQDKSGVSSEEAVEAVHDVLWGVDGGGSVYMLTPLFEFYAALAGFCGVIGLNAYSQLVEDCKLASQKAELTKKSDLDRLFIAVDTASKAVEAEAESDGMNRAKALSIDEFVNCLVNYAAMRYVMTAEEPSIARAITRLFDESIAPRCDPNAFLDANAFRVQHCYCEATDQVLKRHEENLRLIFEVICEKRGPAKRLLTYESWAKFVKRLDLINADLSERDVAFAFTWSRMVVAQPYSAVGSIKNQHVPFEGWLEALCRLSALKALPTDLELGRELYEELIAAGKSPATAAATVEAGAEPGGSSAGRYLNDLKANDPAAYNALLTTRATFWGAEPPQPVSRCIDHLLSMIFFTIGTEGDAIRNPWDERSSPLGEKQINKYFKNFDTS